MNSKLLRINFFVLTCALLFGGFSIDAKAQVQQLDTVWERSDRTGAEQPKPDWFTVGSVRGAGYGVVNGNERFYVADRANNTIRIMDPETGADITPDNAFDLTGVSGGTFSMNDVEVSDDGIIFLGNLASATSPFNLYWWTEEGGTFAGSTSIDVAGRVGDKFSVVGSVADNTVEIWMPVASSNPGIVHKATTSDQGATWDIETITLTGDNVALPASTDAYPLEVGGTSDFYVAGNGSSPKRYTSTGEYVADSQFPAANFTGSRNGFEAFKLNGEDHLAVYTYRPDGVDTGNKTGKVYVYNVSNATSPLTVAESPMIGDDVDTFSSIHGVAQVRLNDDGTYNVYMLEGVNGFAAFRSSADDEPVAELPSNLYFSEYIEGTSNNKALEIFNNTDSTVSLTNYRIEQSSNGDGWEFYHEFAEGAAIDAGGTYVLITDQVDPTLFAAENADEVLGFPSPIHFNGNDARALIHINPATEDTTRLDVFGDPDSDVTWDVAGVSEAASEQTLLRKASVAEGNPAPLASFGTNADDSEWIVLDQNDFSNLGEPTPEEQPLEPLAGTYYIPQGDNDSGFNSLFEAISVVNEVGLSSETTFLIDADITETEQLRINRGDLGETNRLYIKPAPGKQVTISTNDFRLVDTGYITVDGSDNGDDSRNLTFEKSEETGGFIGLLSNTLNVEFKNVNIIYADQNGSGTYAVLINRRESGDDSGRAENVTFDNVQIGEDGKSFRDAFWLFGSTSVAEFFHRNVSITNGEFFVGRSALRTQTHTNTVFSGNSVHVQAAEAGGIPAINLNTPIESFTFSGNEISFESNSNDTGGQFVGLNVTNTLIEQVMISNNTFTNAAFTSGSSTDNSFYAVRHDGAATIAELQLYHNSVYLTDVGQSGEHSAVGLAAGSSTAATLSAVNNIFVNDRAQASSTIYQWYDQDQLTADYNNIVTASPGLVATVGDAEFELLIDWTDIGKDENSSEASVEFVSGTDLRLTGSSIGDNDLAGTPLAVVSTDIDGNQRSELAPYKGAFEGDIELTGDVQIGAFALLSPEDGLELDLMSGDPESEVTITWEEPTSAEEVTYTWHADSLGGDFSEPLLSIESDGNGSETTLTLTFQAIDTALGSLGVEVGETADLIWTVTAETETSVRFADQSFELSITRNLGVSREISENPREFSLSQNYPNPFNPSTTIEFVLPASADVRLQVYNINGQLVSTLVNSRMNAGEHSVSFDASNLASGVYIYRIMAGSFTQTKQMTLIK